MKCIPRTLPTFSVFINQKIIMNVAIIFVMLFRLSSVFSLKPIENYYWKDFNGLAPKDAFEVEPGQYIGSVPIARQGVFIGLVQNGSKFITVSITDANYNRYYTTANANIKILCTDDSSSLQWIRTSNETFTSIPYEVIVGGYDDDVLYIGKVDNLAIGRTSSRNNYILQFTNGEGGLYENAVYDVLVGNPNAKKTDTSSIKNS